VSLDPAYLISMMSQTMDLLQLKGPIAAFIIVSLAITSILSFIRSR
jgi:hypothetical protein